MLLQEVVMPYQVIARLCICCETMLRVQVYVVPKSLDVSGPSLVTSRQGTGPEFNSVMPLQSSSLDKMKIISFNYCDEC